MKKILLFILLIPSLCFAQSSGENTIGGYIASPHLIQVATAETLSPAPYLDFVNATGDTLNGTTYIYTGSGGGGGGSGTVSSGTVGQESVYTGTTTVGSGIITDNGTDIGIGTTSPAQLLEVNGTGQFDSTLKFPSPFTLGSTSVTTTGTQLNYLNSATGTTGTTSTNLVFSTSPTLVTPTLGVASATTINKVTLTAPATGSTLTIADGKTLTATNTVNLNTMTDTKMCTYTASGTALNCATTPPTECSTSSCNLNTSTTLNSQGICLTNGTNCPTDVTGGGSVTYSDNGITVTANTYYAPIGGGGLPSTTEANVDVPASAAATFTNLQVGISAAPGVGNTVVVTLRDGGASKALTCTISGASAVNCNDLVHSFNVVQGDLIDWQIVTTGTIIGTPTITIMAAAGTSSVGTTSVSVVSANGLAGTVANSTTTPAITLSTTITGILKGNGTAISAGTAGSDYTSPSSTETQTNKRRTYRTVTTTQSATPTINTDNGDVFEITALAQAITSMTTNLTGTPNDNDALEIQITDNGTARAITWGTSFASSTVTLPTTTVISTLLSVYFEWNSTSSKWVCKGVA